VGREKSLEKNTRKKVENKKKLFNGKSSPKILGNPKPINFNKVIPPPPLGNNK